MDTSNPATMRTVVTDDAVWGRLRIGEAPRPQPASADALVRVAAVSLNRGELKTAFAAPGGWRPGWDFAGVVEAASSDGCGFAVGTRVVGLAPIAGWSDYVVASSPFLARVPDSVDLHDAATLPVAGLTARAALAKGGRLTGLRVLITGSSGGVGVFAIQLAALQGARVTAAIRNPEHTDLVRQLGAEEVALGDTLAGAEARGPFDLILDSVGGESLAAALGMLAPGGTCVLLGASAGERTTFDAPKFRIGGTSLYGLVMGYEFRREPPAAGLADLLALVEAGKLRVMIGRRAPVSEVAQVADDLAMRRFVGKAVLTFHSQA
ncbi:MAG TPA: zinc-binding dehydrogenase [Caulobacteraceae bacterium]|jgi:NADPH:quinone reductase-like Zn-dependent oxidoreductase